MLSLNTSYDISIQMKKYGGLKVKLSLWFPLKFTKFTEFYLKHYSINKARADGGRKKKNPTTFICLLVYSTSLIVFTERYKVMLKQICV